MSGDRARESCSVGEIVPWFFLFFSLLLLLPSFFLLFFFCSAVLSRNTMQADIHNIGFCPYILTIYETNAKPGTINVSYRKLSNGKNTDKSLEAVENMLDGIAREAVE